MALGTPTLGAAHSVALHLYLETVARLSRVGRRKGAVLGDAYSVAERGKCLLCSPAELCVPVCEETLMRLNSYNHVSM